MVKTVLLAYERDQDLAAIETHLQTRGLRVIKARTGLEALEMVKRDGPDFLVADVLLPKMDGFALCRRVKEDAGLNVPVVLFSMRVEGTKYEAFAAEVGADRFLQRGATLEDLAGALDELSPGTSTIRMPALLPELLDRREHDRRRLAELERRLQELEATNQQLAAAERVARERAEHEAHARAEFAASQSARIRELVGRIGDLEATHQQLVQVESRARTATEALQADATRLAALESQLREAQAGRSQEADIAEEKLAALEARLAGAQAAREEAAALAREAERAFAAQPVPAWLCEREGGRLRLVNDAAAALFGLEAAQLRGRLLGELIPALASAADGAGVTENTVRRADGSEVALEVTRRPASFDGRACWLMAARDVTADRLQRRGLLEQAHRARVLERLPEACCIVEAEGRLGWANAAFLELVGLEAARLPEVSLATFEVAPEGDATIRSFALGDNGRTRQVSRWRRTDGTVIEVELESIAEEGGPRRVVVVRDLSAHRLEAERAERDQQRALGLLELAQRAHSLTEGEILAHSLELLEGLTRSPSGCVFLALPEAGQLELVARRGEDFGPESRSMLTRWRGTPATGTALLECMNSLRPVLRESGEPTGELRGAGLPVVWRRQLVTPMLDGPRLVGVLLLADKPDAYDDDDRRHAAHVADGLWRLLRRRRSDAEIVSAMDHMERVMFGTIEALAALTELQDGGRIGRSRRVAELAGGIGGALGLPGHTLRGLRVMGQLIDVGMLQIPRELLWRPGSVSAAEFDLIRTHAERGAESLRHIEFPWPVAEVVRQHHERFDGSGYPRGMRGEQIMLEARIVAVADAVEAMLSSRPHRAALTVTACIDELQSQSGRRYDARVVKACVKLLRDREASGPIVVAQRADDESIPGQRIA
ncbi:MAG TPA: HD domain-containing phosphohydrolase [Steroidobacteraceae bacterium]|nr:HD domain-containing phosphohydrolase [Steroidobacteraceae bacterium]